MSAKDAVYAALPPDADVVRAYGDGKLEQIVSGVMGRCAPFGHVEPCTALLHYLLSVLCVPSQRKIESGGVFVDVVVPDLATLRRRPEAALVICVCEAGDGPGRAREALKVQPDPRNVWMACPSEVPGYRTFAGGSLGSLPAAAARFLEGAGSGRLRILGSRG